MTDARRWTVRCPDCGAELAVDAETGAIVEHRKSKAEAGPAKELSELFADLDARKARAEDLFEQERAAYADRDRLLEEKFKAALERAKDEPDLPPKRPFDLD